MEMTGLGNRVFHGFERYQGMKKENSERMFQPGGGGRGSWFTFICCLQSSLMLPPPGRGIEYK